MIRNILKKWSVVRTTVGLFVIAAATARAQDATPAPATQSPAEPISQTSGEQSIGAAQPGGQVAANQPGLQPTQEATTERVIVTGSNIPTAEEVGPNPVLNINRDLIDKSGERNAAALIKNLPVANANGVPISNNQTGFTPGASSVALRGFTPEATLVLIDGRRIAPYPLGQGGTTSFIDLSSIPRAAIDSIEILKDGASTTYGADAVAGVVNIKLRHDYRGAEAYVEYGNTLDKDAGQFHSSVVFGVGDEKTQVTGVMNYDHENSTFNRDRAFSARPPFLSSNSSPLNLSLSTAVVAAAGGPDLTGTRTTIFAHAPFFTNGLAPASAYTYTAGRSSAFNFNQFAQSYPESERWGGFANFSHKWLGDQVVVYGDFFYQHSLSHQELAPSATGSFQTAGSTTLAIPPGMPLNGVAPPNTPTFEATGVPANAFNPFNPFNQIISGGTRARLAEFGNRLFDYTTDAFFATAGFRGDKLFDGNWGYDTAFRYSQIKNTSQGTLVSASRFNRVLNAADPIFDPTSPQFIGTTVPYNPFTDYRVDFASNQATVAFATVHPKDIDISSLATVDLNIYSTQLFKLPAGGVGFAIGGQFRRERLEQDPDQINIEGDTIGSSPTAATNAGRKDYALYAELSIPIFSPQSGITGFHSLELSASTRFEAFLNNDTNVVVPKFGVRWQPFDEQLTVRATWGEGFREPSLFELFSSPTSALAGTSFDPETPVIFSSNPNLQPEDSRSFSGGVVYTPKFLSGLTFSVDLWDIERTGVVTTPTAQSVINRFNNNMLLPGESVVFNADGTINRVAFTFQNSGQQRARGIDMGVQYQYQSPFGTFTSLTQATYTDSFVFQTTAFDRAMEVSGHSVGGMGDDAWLKWRGTSRLDWAWNGIDVNTTLRYTSGFHEKIFGPAAGGFLKEHWVDATWTVDGQASYDFSFVAPVESQPVAGYSKDSKEVVRGKDGSVMETAAGQTTSYGLPIWKQALNNTTITVGCNNIFGQDPPKAFGQLFGNSNGYPGFIYDTLGRFVYVSLTKKF